MCQRQFGAQARSQCPSARLQNAAYHLQLDFTNTAHCVSVRVKRLKIFATAHENLFSVPTFFGGFYGLE